METLNLDYYYGRESEQFTFFRIPKVLYIDKAFKHISSDAKVLYGILLDRMSLSRMNGWMDKDNKVYIIYPIEEIQEILGCGNKKAVKIMAELDTNKGIGLIEKKRQGLGKPNLIYVKNFITLASTTDDEDTLNPHNKLENQGEIQKCENDISTYTQGHLLKCENDTSEMSKGNDLKFQKDITENVEMTLQELAKGQCNNTNYNNTNLSNNEFNNIDYNHINRIYQKEDGQDGIEKNRYEKYSDIVKANIEFDYLKQQYRDSDIQNIVDLIAEISVTENGAVRVNGNELPVDIVKGRLLRLNYMHICYVLDTMQDNPSDIRNIRSYLITTLFNAPATIDQYYKSKVNHDLNGGGRYL